MGQIQLLKFRKWVSKKLSQKLKIFQIEKKKEIKSLQHGSSGSKFNLFIFLKNSYF